MGSNKKPQKEGGGTPDHPLLPTQRGGMTPPRPTALFLCVSWSEHVPQEGLGGIRPPRPSD